MEKYIKFKRMSNRTHSVRGWLNNDQSITLITDHGGFFGPATTHEFNSIEEATRLTKDWVTYAPDVVDFFKDWLTNHSSGREDPAA